MELIEGSETSANHNRTPGKYTKEYIQYSKHGESLLDLSVAVELCKVGTYLPRPQPRQLTFQAKRRLDTQS